MLEAVDREFFVALCVQIDGVEPNGVSAVSDLPEQKTECGKVDGIGEFVRLGQPCKVVIVHGDEASLGDPLLHGLVSEQHRSNGFERVGNVVCRLGIGACPQIDGSRCCEMHELGCKIVR